MRHVTCMGKDPGTKVDGTYVPNHGTKCGPHMLLTGNEQGACAVHDPQILVWKFLVQYHTLMQL